jgi:hypothetical protein
MPLSRAKLANSTVFRRLFFLAARVLLLTPIYLFPLCARRIFALMFSGTLLKETAVILKRKQFLRQPAVQVPQPAATTLWSRHSASVTDYAVFELLFS